MTETIKKTFEKNKRNKGPQTQKPGGKPKGKKPFNKGKKKPVQLKRDEPVFLYLCACHGEKAVKIPCERTAEDRAEGKKSESPLGTWRCSISKKKTKVSRKKNKPEEVNETNSEATA